MTDKERILIQIAAMTSFKTSRFNNFQEDDIHWEVINEDTELNKNDIVCGMTNPHHKFGVAFFEKRIGRRDLLVREIGSNATCDYTNEMFLVLRNFPEMYKLCGNERKVMMKIRRVFNDLYNWCFCSVRFDAKKLVVKIRKRWTSDTKTFEIKYDCPLSRITLKSIRSAVENQMLD